MEERTAQKRSMFGPILSVLAVVIVVVVIQYGQLLFTGSSPQPAVWVAGTVAVVIVAVRSAIRRR